MELQKKLFKNFMILIVFAACVAFFAACERKDGQETAQTEAVTAPVSTPAPQSQEKLGLLDISGNFVTDFKQEFPGVELSFLIENLDNGINVTYNSKQMRSASLIKLFIMEHIYKEAAAGRYELTEDRKKDLYVMITESDNMAANRFIDDFGGVGKDRKIDMSNTVNVNIGEMGYEDTELNHKMYDKIPPEGPTKYQNYSSVSDIAELLRGLYKGELLKGDYNRDALKLLSEQKRRTKIPLRITEKYMEVAVYNKTGELAQVENDAAIIEGEGYNLVFVIMTDNIPRLKNGDINYAMKEKIQQAIGDFALELVEFYMKRE